MNSIPFYLHDLGRPELDAIAEVLGGPILTTGDTVGQFEREFASYLGRKHALGVTSCTGAMHMVLLALDIGPGDEVITTPMTFIATSTAILEAGAKPVFVDVEPDTGNLDASRIEAAITEKTRAILPVHLYGLMCDMKAIKKISDKYRLNVIEDCAHCVEGERDGIKPGQLSDAACFSFYATKNLTCGEGGAIVTDRDDLVEKLRLLRLHGMTKMASDRQKEGYKHWDMVILGWKYNMDNIQAAMLLPQMKRIEANSLRRQKLAELYKKLLSNISKITLLSDREQVKHARHLFPILIHSELRDYAIDQLKNSGISVMVNYRAIHLLSYFKNEYGFKEGDFPMAEKIGREVISLPFYPSMSEESVLIVAECLSQLCEA